MPTKIEWAEESLNAVTGCTEASPGCANCYARKMSKRLIAMGQEKYFDTIDEDGRWTGEVRFHPEVLDVPATWKKPRRVFFNSMSDTFHRKVTRSQIHQMLDSIAGYPDHTFIIATKRASRAMIEINYFCDLWTQGNPIPNLWLLVSVENQAMAEKRIPHLLETNVAVRGLSMEPLLGPVNFDPVWLRPSPSAAFSSGRISWNMPSWTRIGAYSLDWVIVGGESGPSARPIHPDWVRSIRDQCVSAGVPFFFKQWGRFLPIDQVRRDDPEEQAMIAAMPAGRQWCEEGFPDAFDIGKKKAGRHLDGREWNEYPDDAKK